MKCFICNNELKETDKGLLCMVIPGTPTSFGPVTRTYNKGGCGAFYTKRSYDTQLKIESLKKDL